MNAILYWNKSDKRYINKNIEQIQEITLDLIEPSSIIEPTLILSPNSRVVESNYIFIPDLGRYYFINDYIFEYERIIVHTKVDVLMSFAKEIMDLNVIFERSSPDGTYNLYLNDPELKLNNYSSFQTLKFKSVSNIKFSENTEQLVMVCSGSV